MIRIIIVVIFLLASFTISGDEGLNTNIVHIEKLWSGIPQPQGFVADISSKSEATQEYADVENYFSGKHWRKINPEASDIRYMTALMWMNEKSAIYYSQSFLSYLASKQAFETQYDVPDKVVDYFLGEFSVLRSLSKEQLQLAKKVINEYQSARKE